MITIKVDTERFTASMTNALRAAWRAVFDQARSKGMTAEQAGRWVAYLDMKAAKGEPPVTLEEALAQIRLAKRSAREALAAVATAGEPS